MNERLRAAADEMLEEEWLMKLKADHDDDHWQGLDQLWGGKGAKRCQWCDEENINS